MVNFNYYPSLIVKCLDSMELNDLFHISSAVIDLVRFCFFRKLIDVGDIEICCKENQNEVIDYHKVGSLHINYKRKEIEPIELNSITDYGFIPWSFAYCHLPILMSMIYKKEIYLDYLPEQRLDRFLVSRSSVSLDAAAFEFEFKRRFPKYKTKKTTDAKYVNLKCKLEEIELTKDSKGLLKDIIAKYFESPSLSEKSEYVIEQYKDLLIPFFKRIGLSSLDSHKIAMDFSNSRNLIDHGSINLLITSDIAKASLIIRASVICMQLEMIGMDRERISKVIRILFDCLYL